ncbi:hypothetical protein K0M31_003733 [Melipona bicolor]|uniref:Uncharacterized protein n=1 Tax=Melipona bicolor TaxID=60889 RepID=A0AA40KNP3_9HYME|nr:hypothetical protein K0M31_003733 [Melipona bicolor]
MKTSSEDGRYGGWTINSKVTFKKDFKSLDEIIFGWDRFNSVMLLVFILLFLIWAVTFFVSYNMYGTDGHSTDHDHNHGSHGNWNH